MEWLRLYTEVLDDAKIAKMSDTQYRIFTYLMLIARENDQNGSFTYNENDIAWRIRRPKAQIKNTVQLLIELNIITIENNILTFINWKKRQYKSDDVTSRVKRFRHKSETLQPTLENRTEQIQNRAEKKPLQPPVDNSSQKPEIKAEPVPEPQKEKNAFFEKRNKEFSEVMAKIKAKYDYKQQQEIENWIKANYRGKHPDALIHTLNSIVHPVRPGKPDISISLYLDKVIALENQNYNAADYDKQAAEFKKPGMFSISDIFAGIKLHGAAT